MTPLDERDREQADDFAKWCFDWRGGEIRLSMSERCELAERIAAVRLDARREMRKEAAAACEAIQVEPSEPMLNPMLVEVAKATRQLCVITVCAIPIAPSETETE